MPTAVVDDLLSAFDHLPVLAFGEDHSSIAEHRVLLELVCDPRFAKTVDAVVVELANQRLQPVIDRYAGGEDVSAEELASVWRESTQRSGVWEADVYRTFFATIRWLNRDRGPDEQMRVLAGDPLSTGQGSRRSRTATRRLRGAWSTGTERRASPALSSSKCSTTGTPPSSSPVPGTCSGVGSRRCRLLYRSASRHASRAR
jgi:hypothetical protein